MLGSQDFEKLVLKPLKVGSEELKSLLLRLATEGDPFSLFKHL